MPQKEGVMLGPKMCKECDLLAASMCAWWNFVRPFRDPLWTLLGSAFDPHTTIWCAVSQHACITITSTLHHGAPLTNNHSGRHVSSKHHDIMICARYKEVCCQVARFPRHLQKHLKTKCQHAKDSTFFLRWLHP